ncbi:MAG: YhcH/YjgK/YiaL family protein [Vibrionaceae bacterium]
MIISDIKQLANLGHLETILRSVLQIDLMNAATGEHLIKERDIFFSRASTSTRTLIDSKPEVHRDYLDIHLVLAGKENIGYQIDAADPHFLTHAPFNNDYELIDHLADEQFVTLTAGQFAVIYPGTWHRPTITFDKPQPLEKIVVKVHKQYLANLK